MYKKENCVLSLSVWQSPCNCQDFAVKLQLNLYNYLLWEVFVRWLGPTKKT